MTKAFERATYYTLKTKQEDDKLSSQSVYSKLGRGRRAAVKIIKINGDGLFLLWREYTR